MTKESTKPFQIDKPRTWLQRAGQLASTDLEGAQRRYIVLRWSDTGETEMRDIIGDAWNDLANATVFSEWDLGVTASIGDAVAAADVMRNDPQRLDKRLGGRLGRLIERPEQIEFFAAALSDAYTDGGGSYPELPEIGEILRNAVTVEEFVAALTATDHTRWALWAEALRLGRPTPADTAQVVRVTESILEPIASIPVVTIDVNKGADG
jgi:hypothetical protein